MRRTTADRSFYLHVSASCGFSDNRSCYDLSISGCSGRRRCHRMCLHDHRPPSEASIEIARITFSQELSPLPVSASSPPECNATTQRLGLVLLYNSTDGPSWSNSHAWPSIPGLSSMDVSSLEQYMTAMPLQSGGCVTSTGAEVVLPDHCCWNGVSCCSPRECGNDPYCNCTTGLVTSIVLSRNQVGCRCLQHALSVPLTYSLTHSAALHPVIRA